MPARIEDNQLAYAEDTGVPWHGMGHGVQRGTTGEEMLEIAGLNWPVELRDINVNGLTPEQTSNFRAVVRADTGRMFAAVSKRYQVVQNTQIVDFFREYCEAGKATMETVGAIDGGSKIWALAKLNPELTTANIGGVDEMQGFMLLATSHDMSLQHVGRPTQICVVCMNTLGAALGLNGGNRLGEKVEHEFRAKHTRKWDSLMINEAQRVMGTAVEKVQQLNEFAEKMSKVSIDAKGREEFLNRLLMSEHAFNQMVADTLLSLEEQAARDAQLQDKVTQKLGAESRLGKSILAAILNSTGSELVTRHDTMWGAINGVTYYTDHTRGRTPEGRLNSAWFGDGADLKQKAVDVALQMTGVA